jgi:hypothetical protein
VHEEGTELHLLKAVPDWWLADGQTIRISKLPTWFGNLSMTITGRTGGIDVKLDGPAREKPARIVLHLPENRPLLNPVPGVSVETRKPQAVRWDFNKVVALYQALPKYK